MQQEIEHYIQQIDEGRRAAFLKLYQTIETHLPKGFEACMQYGMPTFVVPLSRYPKGYLKKAEALPFISIAAQKNYIALYHIGLYGDDTLLKWFQARYAQKVPTKLNMGKSCVRFTNTKHIPYTLIGELCTRITVDDWIAYYESRDQHLC
ncbi:DUF1801 domain-containing protein [Staphylococcus chromogenes]|uniref:DUF1801 domain-containing protein n=1 Tax=Staphylococcus chromogenes TaxID=46126 RepID=UPI000D03761D|nr:DUF1801 domain-containing protein [Staphylococcus chromogenes]